MKTRIDFMTEAVAGVATALQTDEYLRIISFALTCISVTLSLAFTVYKWYKASKADGRITTDELDELVDELEKYNERIKKG